MQEAEGGVMLMLLKCTLWARGGGTILNLVVDQRRDSPKPETPLFSNTSSPLPHILLLLIKNV